MEASPRQPPPVAGRDPAAELLALYDRALPQVYGYLLHRCGGIALAEDLTGETFLAAVDAVRRDSCRAAPLLRDVDDLPVSEVADVLGRTVHATEALLVRARRAFRRAYEQAETAAPREEER